MEDNRINEEDIEETADNTEDTVMDDALEEEAAKGEEDGCETSKETSESGKDVKKKGIFGKDKKDKKDQLIDELTDKYKRTFAEFDNFRKRTEKEKSAMYEVGARDIIERILPVVDNFERGFATVTEEEMSTPFIDGMDKVYKQLIKALEDAGVKPIEAVGQEFNPDFHNAVMHVEDDTLGENIIAEELQKGYMYRDTVVRHSMVKVAN